MVGFQQTIRAVPHPGPGWCPIHLQNLVFEDQERRRGWVRGLRSVYQKKKKHTLVGWRSRTRGCGQRWWGDTFGRVRIWIEVTHLTDVWCKIGIGIWGVLVMGGQALGMIQMWQSQGRKRMNWRRFPCLHSDRIEQFEQWKWQTLIQAVTIIMMKERVRRRDAIKVWVHHILTLMENQRVWWCGLDHAMRFLQMSDSRYDEKRTKEKEGKKDREQKQRITTTFLFFRGSQLDDDYYFGVQLVLRWYYRKGRI